MAGISAALASFCIGGKHCFHSHHAQVLQSIDSHGKKAVVRITSDAKCDMELMWNSVGHWQGFEVYSVVVWLFAMVWSRALGLCPNSRRHSATRRCIDACCEAFHCTNLTRRFPVCFRTPPTPTPTMKRPTISCSGATKTVPQRNFE